jgi:uncharacterized protein YidB (DUF937 family)
MGLLDSVVGALGAGGGGGQPDLMKIVMGLMEQSGGLPGLLQKLQQGGLADQAASWVSTGQNLPVSGDQLSGALGGDLLGERAEQVGMGQGDLSGSLAQMLPQLIDKMTPDGQVPAAGAMPDLGSLLGGLLRR